MFEWLSDNRASIAAGLIVVFVCAFVWSIAVGKRQARLRAKDEVFGDPVRTKGGWYWAVCGVSALMLVWFYYSWGTGRAYFPKAANEMCQIAKLEEAVSPIKAALPIGSRYYKSTLLVSRNTAQLDALERELPTVAFTDMEQSDLLDLVGQIRALMANASDPSMVNPESKDQLIAITERLDHVSAHLIAGTKWIDAK